MEEEKTEGIVLRSLEYRDRQRLISVFTPEHGLISLIVKGISKKNPSLLALTTPFSHGEFHFRKRRSEIFSFCDGHLIKSFSHFRQNLSYLQTAGEIISALLYSQMPGKPSPMLYRLTLSYLDQIDTFQDPTSLLSSFYLKLFKHDGLLALSPHCSQCEKQAQCLYEGESCCIEHAPIEALFFSKEEWNNLLSLINARSFLELQRIHFSQEGLKKIKIFLKIKN